MKEVKMIKLKNSKIFLLIGALISMVFLVLAFPTIPSFISPANNSVFFTTPTLTCSGSDENIYYNFFNSSSTKPMQNTTSTTFSWTGLNPNQYIWWCKACNNSLCGSSIGTGVTNTHNVVFSTQSGGHVEYYGMKILIGPNAVKLTNVTLPVSDLSRRVVVLDSSKNELAERGYDYGTPVIFGYILQANTTYYIVGDGAGTEAAHRYNLTGITYPKAGTYMNWTGGLNVGSDVDYGVWAIQSIGLTRWDIDVPCCSNATENRTLNRMNFTNCTSGNTSLNLSFMDEKTGLKINATLPTIQLDFSSADNYTYSFGEPNINKTNFMFCLDPANISIAAEGEIKYEFSPTYPLRTFYLTDTLNGNTTLNKILYLLDTDSGIVSSIQVITITNNPIEGVLIKLERNLLPPGYNSTYVTVAQGSTDGAGIVSFWVNPNYEYRLTVSKAGYSTQVQYLTPTQDLYTIVMSASTSDIEYYSPTEGMDWTITPPVGFIPKNTGVTTTTFGFNITAEDGDLRGCKFEIINSSGDILASAEGCLAAGEYSGANLSDTYAVKSKEELWGIYYTKVLASCDNDTGNCIGGAAAGNSCNETADCVVYGIMDNAHWYEYNATANVTSWTTLNGFFVLLKSADEFGTGAEAEMSKIIWFFLMATIAIVGINFFTGLENQHPGAAVIIIAPIILFASLAGFFTFSFTTPTTGFGSTALSSFLNQYTVAMMAGMLMIGYFVNNWRREQA